MEGPITGGIGGKQLHAPGLPGLESLCAALDLFCAYDTARLSAYSEGEDRDRIATLDLGKSRALRFSEVGYFNRVYHVDGETIARLPEVLAFYEDIAQPVELVAAAGCDLSLFSAPLRAAGFRPGPSYARVETRSSPLSPGPDASNVRVVTPREGDRNTFLDLYLRGFGADERNIQAAKANMLRLFELPGLHFSMGLVDGVPAGIGMLYVLGDRAFLCAGATLPAFEQRGCHTALIRRRLELARELGAQQTVSWAHEGSASHRNMVAQGLQTIAVDRAWLRPPA